MALLFCDSFDHYTSPLDKWNALGNGFGTVAISAGNGRRGTSALLLSVNSGSAWIQKFLSPADSTFIAGFSYKIASLSATYRILTINNGASDQIYLEQGADGSLRIVSATTLYTSSAALLGTNVWYNIQFKVIIGNSGSYELRLNGATVTSGSGDTQAGSTSTWTNFYFGPTTFGPPAHSFYIDDLYVLDGSGSVNNNFLGDVRVEYRAPTADGNSGDGTPSTGTDNYAVVDETAPNTTDYNTLTTTSQKDTFAIQDATSGATTILGFQTLLYAEKTDTGDGFICPVVRSNGTDYDGSSVALSNGTYGYVRQIYDTNPDTGSQMTEAEFNAAEFGYKRTA